MATVSPALDLAGMIKALTIHREAIDAAITNLMVASGGMVATTEGGGASVFAPASSGSPQPTELPRGAFLGKSLPAAVKLYLSAVIKKQTLREIAVALREGGVESTSDNFEGVISGALHRMKANGEVLQFKEGFALAEFYPAHIRASLSHGVGSPRKRTKKPPKKVKSAKKPLALAAESLEQRVMSFAIKHPSEWITFRDVMNAFPDISRQAAASTLGRIAKSSGWDKSDDGKYLVPKGQ
jgi:hypothetical protein